MRLDQGGHLTHGSPASITSKVWRFVSYGLTPASDDPSAPGEIIDLDQVRDLALEHRPKLIVAGATAYSRTIDAKDYRSIADEVGAYLMFDCAHTAGPDRRRCPPEPRGHGGRGDLHDPQDPPGSTRRRDLVLLESWPRRSTAPSSPACRAVLSST